MKKLYNEFFHISKNEKICEKVLVARVAVIVTTIVFCLAAMSLSAYAHFSYNVSSNTNTISISNFEVNVLIDAIDDNGNVIESVTPETTNFKLHTATMQADKTYRITVNHTDSSTAKTGFLFVSAENCPDSFHTVQIGRNDDGTSKTVSFKMKLTADTKVEFLAHWGTSSYYDAYVNNGDDTELYVTEDEQISMNVTALNLEPQNSDKQIETDIIDNTSTMQVSSQALSSETE